MLWPTNGDIMSLKKLLIVVEGASGSVQAAENKLINIVKAQLTPEQLDEFIIVSIKHSWLKSKCFKALREALISYKEIRWGIYLIGKSQGANRILDWVYSYLHPAHLNLLNNTFEPVHILTIDPHHWWYGTKHEARTNKWVKTYTNVYQTAYWPKGYEVKGATLNRRVTKNPNGGSLPKDIHMQIIHYPIVGGLIKQTVTRT
jgi:hypothetical protein